MEGYKWANVADDLFFLLAEKLVGVTTFIRFSAVCKSWNSVASATKCSKLVPWLMLVEKKDSDMRDFYDNFTAEVYQFHLPQARGVKHLGFAHGWLITCGEDASLNLLNPLSGAQIPLPNLFEEYNYSATDIRDVITIKATCSPVGPDNNCIVVLTYQYHGYVFSFCQPTDEGWTDLEPPRGPDEVAYVGGTFYTVTDQGKIFSFETEMYPIDDISSSITARNLGEEDDQLFSSEDQLVKIADFPKGIFKHHDNYFISYIVQCGGDLLAVVKTCWCFRGNTRNVSKVDFKVFKVDVEGKKVVEVKDIGDYSLFLGTNNSISLQTSLYGSVFKRNSIYFSQYERFGNDVDEVGENMSVFDLENGTWTTQSVGASKSVYFFPLWVILDPLSYTDKNKTF